MIAVNSVIFGVKLRTVVGPSYVHKIQFFHIFQQLHTPVNCGTEKHYYIIKYLPRTGSGAVMRRDSSVGFGAMCIVCLCICLTSFLLSLCFLSYLFTSLLVRSTPPSRPNKVGLKCPSVRLYVRPSTKSFFDFNDTWYVVEVDE